MPDRSRSQPRAGRQSLTPLMLQAAADRADVVSLLIEHGAEVNAFNANKGSALSFAVHNGYDDMARILRQAGARTRQQRSC